MIVELLADVLKAMLRLLMVFDLPNLPDEVMTYLNEMFGYIDAAGGLLANYTPLSYLLTLFGCVLAVDVGIGIYHIVMWVLAKIPVFKVDR